MHPYKFSEVSSLSKNDRSNSLGQSNKKNKKIERKASLFKNFETKGKNSSPNLKPERRASPLKIKEMEKEFNFKGTSINGSLQGGDESYISNPSIMETDGNKINNISPLNKKRSNVKLSGFSGIYNNNQINKSQVLSRNKTTCLYQKHNNRYAQRSMSKLDNASNYHSCENKIPLQSSNLTNYDAMQKIESVNSLDFDSNERKKKSMVYKKPRRKLGDTRISIFGRASPKNRVVNYDNAFENSQGSKLRPLVLNKLKHPDSESSEDEDISQKKKSRKLFENFEESESVSISSPSSSESYSMEAPINSQGKKLTRLMTKKRSNLKIKPLDR